MAGNLKERYETETAYRDSWINDAERSAALTIPNIRVRGLASTTGRTRLRTTSRVAGAAGSLKPFTNVGRDGVNTLANTLLTLLFPLDIRWFRLTIDEQQRQQLLEAGVFETDEQIEETLRAIEDRMISRMDDHALRSTLHALFRRNLIEGNDVLHLFRKEDGGSGLRIIPLRNFVAKRINGELNTVIVRDETAGPDGKARELYTEVDYQSGKVSQQEMGSTRKTPQQVKDNPNFYILVSPAKPLLEDYADGYVYELSGDLELHNNLAANVDRAVTIFSKTILVNDSERSGISIYELADLQPGEAIDGHVTSDGRADGIGFVTAGTKLSDIGFVVQWMERIEDRLTRQFAGMLSSMLDQFSQPRSATEVARVASELDTFAAGLGQIYNANLQRPLAQAYLDLVTSEMGQDPRASAIKPTIVAGNSQLSRLQELSKFLQALSTQLQLNPNFAQEIKWRGVWQRVTNSLGINTDDVLKTADEVRAEQQAIAEQQQAQQIRDQQLAALRQQRIGDNARQNGAI